MGVLIQYLKKFSQMVRTCELELPPPPLDTCVISPSTLVPPFWEVFLREIFSVGITHKVVDLLITMMNNSIFL
jgi:hypothetical protein